jgi:thymidylate kinase
MIKIAFSGIPGSGKSSILNEVKKLLAIKYKVEDVEDTARRNPFDINDKCRFFSQFFFISTQINEENTRLAANPDFILCDRGVLDQYVYWARCIAGRDMDARLAEKDAMMQSIYRFWIRTYDLVVHVRLGFDEIGRRDSGDGIRTPLSASPELLAEQFMQTVAADGLKVFELWNTATVDESAAAVMQEIAARDLFPH